MWILVIICVLGIVLEIIVAKMTNNMEDAENLQSIDYSKKYIKKDYLLTQTELKFYKVLKQITDELNLVVCPQVTLYQIVHNKNFKDFNKIQNKSIDFVITQENCKILLCIELDDASHEKTKRIERDNFVNKLFKDLDIKLLRIPVQNFYNIEELEKKIKESLKNDLLK